MHLALDQALSEKSGKSHSLELLLDAALKEGKVVRIVDKYDAQGNVKPALEFIDYDDI